MIRQARLLTLYFVVGMRCVSFCFRLQFLLFYACSLDPEDCGVKFASKLLAIFLSSNKDRVTR